MSARDGGLREKMLSKRAAKQYGRLTSDQKADALTETFERSYREREAADAEQAFADIGEFL